jgi:hypothetical protein
MLPSIHKLNRWKNAQVVRVGSIQLYFSLHDDCPTCRGLIAFELDGHPRVVCDVSEKRGGIGHTSVHRTFLEPDTTKWLNPREFERQWMELASLPASVSCSGCDCSLPTIGHFARSVSAKVLTLGSLRLYFSYNNNGFWPDLVAFRVEPQEPIVCDLSSWRSTGTVGTTNHRMMLEPNVQKWLTPVEFHQRWLDVQKEEIPF